MKLDATISAKTSYERNGFYLSPSAVLPADLVQRAVAGMDAVRAGRYDTGVPPEESMWNPGDDPRRLCKIENPQIANRAIHDLLVHPSLGRLAAELTGAQLVQVWWVQLLYKPTSGPGDDAPTAIGWHQDRTYWHEWAPDSELFTAWIALSDVTADSGPMRFVPGSHHWGEFPASDFMAQNHDAQRANLKLPPGAQWREVPAILPPGGVSFHDDLTIHGSGPNHSASPRRSFAVHLRTEKSTPLPRDPASKISNKARFLDDPRHCPILFQA